MPYPAHTVTIHTDGSCLGNPGPGGYAAIIRNSSKELVICGGEPETTNNRMELSAVIAALSALRRPLRLRITSDSRYVIDGISKWIDDWKANNWLTSNRKPVKNADLWQLLDSLAEEHEIDWQ